MNQDGGLLINSSRGMPVRGHRERCATCRPADALELQQAMEAVMRVKGVV